MNGKDLLVQRNSAANRHFLIVMTQSCDGIWICRVTADRVVGGAISFYDNFPELNWFTGINKGKA